MTANPDCGASPQSLLLLTSNGLANDELRQEFRDLVLRLPNERWAQGDGAARKQRASQRARAELEAASYNEPDLFEGLDVLILEDPCLMKESFWNSANPSFSVAGAINYRTAGIQTDEAVVKPFYGQGLDGGWCADWGSSMWGGLGSFGFEPHRLRHDSLFDRLAPAGALESILQLRIRAGKSSGSSASSSSPSLPAPATLDDEKVQELLKLVDSAAVIVVNGGSPDFAAYVLRSFGRVVTLQIMQRLLSGNAIYIGRSAGSMVGSADIGLTMEGLMLQTLLGGDSRGLSLTPHCALRPHFVEGWQLACAAYEGLTGLTVVRTTNGGALKCMSGACYMVGEQPDNSSASENAVRAGASDTGVARLAAAFQAAAIMSPGGRITRSPLQLSGEEAVLGPKVRLDTAVASIVGCVVGFLAAMILFRRSHGGARTLGKSFAVSADPASSPAELSGLTRADGEAEETAQRAHGLAHPWAQPRSVLEDDLVGAAAAS